MKYQKILLIAISMLFSYIGFAEEHCSHSHKEAQLLELQTSEGSQIVQIQGDGSVLLPQEVIATQKAKAYQAVNKPYIRNISDIKQKGSKLPFIGAGSLTEDNIEQTCIDFLNANKSKLNINTDNIRLLNKKYFNNRWFVVFRQIFNGIEIVTSEVRFVVFSNGKIQTFTSTYYDDVSVEAAKPKISTLSAQQSAIFGLSNPIESYTFKKNEKLFIIPYLNNGKYIYKLAYDYEIIGATEFFTAYVDANDGSLLKRANHVHHYDAQTTGDGYSINPNAPLESQSILNFCKFNIDGTEYKTDRKGLIKNVPDAAKGKAFTTNLEGQYAKMYKGGAQIDDRLDWTKATPYQFEGTVGSDGNINMAGKTANYDEVFRTLYYHVNVVRNHYFLLGFTGLDKSFPIYTQILPDNQVNTTNATFNAYSSGDMALTFMSANNNLVLIGRLANVVYHEYGHSVNHCIYRDAGKGGMYNSTCNEALADISGAFINDYQDVFRNGYATGYEYLENQYHMERFLDNEFIFPDSVGGESHHDSQILSGAIWDFRQHLNDVTGDSALALETANWIVHTAKLATPDGYTLEEAFSKWYEEMLNASVDQSTEASMYFNEIEQAFSRHHIGFDLRTKTLFEHDNVGDIPNNEAISIVAKIPELSSAPEQVKEVWVNYYSSREPYELKSVLLEKTGDNYEGSIPAQSEDTRINYYFTFKNPYSGGIVKTDEDYVCFVGYEEKYASDFETTANWTVTNESNTERGWKNQEPTLSYMQNPVIIVEPEADNTDENGKKCWMTTTEYSQVSGTYRTLNRTSTLTSPSISLANATFPVVTYYMYYLNVSTSKDKYNTGSGSGKLTTEISIDNGATWRKVDEISGRYVPKHWTWQRQYFPIKKYMQDGEVLSNVQIRFVAYNNTNSSYYIAMIDDIKIINSEDPGSISNKDIAPNITVMPNPAYNETNIEFGQPLINPTISVIDALGKVVLESNMFGEFDSCPIDVNKLAIGVYYIKVDAGKESLMTQLNVVR